MDCESKAWICHINISNSVHQTIFHCSYELFRISPFTEFDLIIFILFCRVIFIFRLWSFPTVFEKFSNNQIKMAYRWDKDFYAMLKRRWQQEIWAIESMHDDHFVHIFWLSLQVSDRQIDKKTKKQTDKNTIILVKEYKVRKLKQKNRTDTKIKKEITF